MRGRRRVQELRWLNLFRGLPPDRARRPETSSKFRKSTRGRIGLNPEGSPLLELSAHGPPSHQPYTVSRVSTSNTRNSPFPLSQSMIARRFPIRRAYSGLPVRGFRCRWGCSPASANLFRIRVSISSGSDCRCISTSGCSKASTAPPTRRLPCAPQRVRRHQGQVRERPRPTNRSPWHRALCG